MRPANTPCLCHSDTPFWVVGGHQVHFSFLELGIRAAADSTFRLVLDAAWHGAAAGLRFGCSAAAHRGCKAAQGHKMHHAGGLQCHSAVRRCLAAQLE